MKVFQLGDPPVILRTKTGTEQAWGAVSKRSPAVEGGSRVPELGPERTVLA